MKKNYKKISISFVTLMSLVGLTTISGLALTAARVSADDIVDNVAITVPISCTMSGNGMNSHTAEIANGTYTPNIGTTTMKVLCNDNSGFSIYATGFTNETIAETNSNKLVGTNTSGNATIDTGLAQSGNTSNWAMKLATNSQATYPITITSDTEGPFSSYHTVPNEYTKVATRLAGTDIGAVAEGSTITSTYAAYINSTQPADTYTGKVKYTLVHPNDAPAPTPPSPFETCDTPVPNLTYMQDLNSSNKATVLASMTEDQQYFLKDRRDEKSYCVAKLKDGNIWMTQNLDHDIKTDGSVTYNNTTTDLGWNSGTSSYDTASWTPSTATYPTGTTTWNNSKTAPESYDPGSLYASSSYVNSVSLADAYIQSCVSGTCDQSIYEQLSSDWIPFVDSCNGTFEQCDMSLMPSATTSIESQHNHLGNYYNWTAAVAMNDSSSYTTDNQDVNQSICPANWTLPKSGNNASNGSFQYLVTQYGWDSSSHMMENPNIWNTPIKSALAGVWYGSLGYVGDDGDWWSPVVKDSGLVYELYAGGNGTVDPDYFLGRGYGLSVRCMSR